VKFDSKNRLTEKHGGATVDEVYRAVIEQKQSDYFHE